ncbi:hypothetical protein [Xanthovirga aplysinae]|uniref:hypothetical protein n=1 Tax=Xanthovirga aplysinae TaxID=2529853 RepID=UPI0012BCAA1C|nr:hypothetical protein [Xanthovirga aplysinae]MTI33148.1 hypothetical protein [Xanthovirga aplysinae]
MLEPKNNHLINVNTANEYKLDSCMGIDYEQGRRIIVEREKLGFSHPLTNQRNSDLRVFLILSLSVFERVLSKH